MSNSIASRGFRAALLVASSALLVGLAACNNAYEPPVEGQPLTWGQQHYLDNQKALVNHDARRSEQSSQRNSAGSNP